MRRAHGALGIVLVRDGRAEERHDGVADELLDRAPEALELVAHALVVPERSARTSSGSDPLGLRRRADEVAEEHGDDLSLLASRRRPRDSDCTAGAAEAEAVRDSPARSSGTSTRAKRTTAAVVAPITSPSGGDKLPLSR